MRKVLIILIAMVIASCGNDEEKIANVNLPEKKLTRDSILQSSHDNFLDSFCISGQVVDYNTFIPIANADISTIPEKFSCKTDSNGFFRIRTDQCSEFVVAAEKPGEYCRGIRVSGWNEVGANYGIIFCCRASDALHPPGEISILGPKGNKQLDTNGYDFMWMSRDPGADIEQSRVIVLDSAYHVVMDESVYLGNKGVFGKELPAGQYYWLLAIRDNTGVVAMSGLNAFKITRAKAG